MKRCSRPSTVFAFLLVATILVMGSCTAKVKPAHVVAPGHPPYSGPAPETVFPEAKEPVEASHERPWLTLDGMRVDVRWGDGDTFSFYDAGRGGQQKARLAGYNTLESYGPVHRWGDWTASELYHLAMKAGDVAEERPWDCTTLEGTGGYGRLLVDCPDLRAHLVEIGLAHLFEIDEKADEAELAIQAKSIKSKAGMWAKGAPTGIITSLHSASEGSSSPYNRICNLATGQCPVVPHMERYETCQEVAAEGSFMTYVPYENRYGSDRADCLR